MPIKEIRDFYNRIIAYVEFDERTGDKTLKDFYGRIQGYYYKSDDTTRDFYNRIIAHGDALSMLIPSNNK